tara:strand:+ start:1553 stop:2905 length:1353 start_codon:yes stop_codon:yes gene_type:complete
MFLKLFFRLFFIFSLLVFSYIIYKSEFVLKGNIRDYYYIYYILSIGLVLLSFIALFFNNNLQLYTCIILITIFIASYAFEIYLTLRDPEKTNLKAKIYKNKTGKLFDKRSRYEFYNDIKLIEKDIVVSVLPNVHYTNNDTQNIFPLSGISNSKTIECNELGYFSIYKSDRYGFNNPDNVWDKNEIDYLVMGDSFIHGSCVNRPDDIPSILRKLSNKNVINLGYSGNGPLIELATLREFFPTSKNVKNIIWFYFEGNDLQNLNNEINNNILLKYYENKNFKQNLKIKQSEVDNIGKKIIENERSRGERAKRKKSISYKIIKTLKLYSTRQVIFFKNDIKKKEINSVEINKIIKKIFTDLKSFSEENNSNLHIILIPDNNRFKKSINFTGNLKQIKKTLDQLNINYFDLYDKFFKKQKNPLDYFPFGFDLNGHYSVHGYSIVAEEVYKYLKE